MGYNSIGEIKGMNALPQQHICNLFAKTQNDKMAITYYPNNGKQRVYKSTDHYIGDGSPKIHVK